MLLLIQSESARGDNGVSFVSSFPFYSIKFIYFQSLFLFLLPTFKIRTNVYSPDDRILFRPERHLFRVTRLEYSVSSTFENFCTDRAIVVRRDYAKRNVSLNDITPLNRFFARYDFGNFKIIFFLSTFRKKRKKRKERESYFVRPLVSSSRIDFPES